MTREDATNWLSRMGIVPVDEEGANAILGARRLANLPTVGMVLIHPCGEDCAEMVVMDSANGGSHSLHVPARVAFGMVGNDTRIERIIRADWN